jgi:hypothetical protein
VCGCGLGCGEDGPPSIQHSQNAVGVARAAVNQRARDPPIKALKVRVGAGEASKRRVVKVL